MDIRNSVYIALFAAIVAGLGIFPPITLPALGAPITAQSLGVMLAGGILGAKRGALSLILFLILIAIGLPLLPGGRGGFGMFASPSGGFLLSWVVGAFVTGLIVEKFWERLNIIHAGIAAIVGGIFVVYAIGIPWLAVTTSMDLLKSFIVSMAYVPGDVIKVVIAASIIILVKKNYPIISKDV